MANSAEPEPSSYPIGPEPITLTQLLKLVGWAETGGQAKLWIAEGLVRVNGAVETRKRRQLVVGDVIDLLMEEAPSPLRLSGSDSK